MKNLIRKYITNIIVFSMIIFAITGCSQPTEQTVIESTVEIVEETVEEITPIAEENELEVGEEIEVAEEYTINFIDCNNEGIVAEQGDIVIVPEYERQKLINLIPTVFDDFTSEIEAFEILDEKENQDGSVTYNVAIKADNLTNNITTQYSVDEETGLAKALFVYQVPVEIEVPAEDFGLTFEVTQTLDGTVTVDKILDLFGNDVTDITVYAGDCIGWSLTKWADAVDFEFGDEISVSQDLNLYPVMDMTYAAIDGEDLTEGVWVNSYNGTAIRMVTSYDGTTVDENYQVKDGKLVTLDGSKQVDSETGEVTETPAPKPEKTPEQGSTAGGAGNGNTSSGGGGQTNNGSEGEAQTGMGHEAAASKFGATYIGNGGGNPHTGSGGHGYILQ